MTRSTADFFLHGCSAREFNVKPPAHVQPDQDPAAESTKQNEYPSRFASGGYPGTQQEPVAPRTQAKSGGSEIPAHGPGPAEATNSPASRPEPVIDASKNEALEGKRAGEEVFRAIFGDSDDDE